MEVGLVGLEVWCVSLQCNHQLTASPMTYLHIIGGKGGFPFDCSTNATSNVQAHSCIICVKSVRPSLALHLPSQASRLASAQPRAKPQRGGKEDFPSGQLSGREGEGQPSKQASMCMSHLNKSTEYNVCTRKYNLYVLLATLILPVPMHQGFANCQGYVHGMTASPSRTSKKTHTLTPPWMGFQGSRTPAHLLIKPEWIA